MSQASEVTLRETFSAKEEEVNTFAAITGDENRIHVDEEYADDAFFGERVVHGVYALSWVSGCLADLPVDGDVILTGFEELEFENPISLEEVVEVNVQYHPKETPVDEKPHEDLVTFSIVTDEERKMTGAGRVFVADSPR